MQSSLYRSMFPVALLIAISASISAQQGSTDAPPLAAQSANQSPAPVVASQVKPVFHRVSGLKMLTFLRRSGVKIAPLSDEMLTSNAIQTSIAAGLLLDDGSIVARLPLAEVEISEISRSTQTASGETSIPFNVPVNIFFILRDGKELALKFLGFDGGTGLSLLQVVGQRGVVPTRDAREETLSIGQRVRLLFPGPAPLATGLSSNDVFVNIGELIGNVTNISRTRSGNVNRLNVKADQLSTSLLGGIAVNDTGETIGLIDANIGAEVEVIPMAGVRRAVERIREGLAHKPRPWLGARGSSLAVVSREQLVFAGWKPAMAASLMTRQTGVVLTSVTPQTPAWIAKLRAGDVIVRVNGGDVKSAEEFSTLLSRTSRKAPVRFTVIRPGRVLPHVVSVTLSESLNPVLEIQAAEERAARLSSSDPLLSRGVETLRMTAELATQLKARGGRFVVFVHPSSAASRSGLLAGDIIESINKEPISDTDLPARLPDRLTLDVVRNGQKITCRLESEITSPTRPQR